MNILGIETSCDETAAAVVCDAAEIGARVRASVVFSQLAEHAPYGGVVPEIAARSHVTRLDGIVAQALAEAGMDLGSIDGIAATAGPGLIGGVLVGVSLAKALALATDRPFIAVNHLEGHALTARLTGDVAFPYLLLLVSGGHCQILLVEGLGRYRVLGTTIDDAIGEAFDKTAKMLGLPYPGGPSLELAARSGDPGRFRLPRPMTGRPGCDFSFSGLKTAVRRAIQTLGTPRGSLGEREIADLCAGFQEAVGAVLVDRLTNAVAACRALGVAAPTLVVAGGVAANQALRAQLQDLAARSGLRFVAPPIALCTDNAAMIAWAGLERLRGGQSDDLAFKALPRWPLDSLAPPVASA
ncbi:MAG: tRNA (adenosine(37)-N6)-threonylcarbamoyltransferase complex transferase subunit TsaD [Alphaproteobacteria bacterium]